jgi:hypothetical protein
MDSKTEFDEIREVWKELKDIFTEGEKEKN